MTASVEIGLTTPGSADARTAIARNAFYLTLGQALTTAFSVALNMALGRSLGAAEFGILYLVMSIAGFAYVLVDGGHGLYMQQEVARRPQRVSELLGTSIPLHLVSAGLICLLTLVATWLLGYDENIRILSTLMMCAGLPFFIAQSYGMVFRGRERMECDAFILACNKALMLAITLPILFVGGRIGPVILAQGIAGVAALCAAVVMWRRAHLPPLHATATVVRELIIRGLPWGLMLLISSIQWPLDAIILSKFAPAETLGWMAAAKTIMGLMITPPAILGAAALPRFARSCTDLDAFSWEVGVALRPVLVLGTLASVGTFLFADMAISILYDSVAFGPAITILQVLSPILLFYYIEVLLGHAVMARTPTRLTTAKFFAILLNSSFQIVIVPICQEAFGNGAIGFLLGLALSELVMVIAVVVFLPRGIINSHTALEFGRALLTGVGTLLIMLPIRALPPLVSIPLCLIIFGALGLATGLFRRTDIKLLRVLGRKSESTMRP